MATQTHGARRRYVLVLIVLTALTLATLSGRSKDSGPIGAVGRIAHRIVQPFAAAADTVFSPVRDWFGGLIHRGDLESTNRRLRREIAALRAQQRESEQAIAQNRYYDSFFNKPFLDAYRTVGAWVQYGKVSNLGGPTITIDRGTESKIVPGMAVIAGDGLVGTIERSWNGGSEVKLVTAQGFGAAIRVLPAGAYSNASMQDDGLLHAGFSVDTRVPARSTFRKGDLALTCGCETSEFPPGIPVGSVTGSTQTGPSIDVRIAPFVDVAALDVVKVVLWHSGDPIPKPIAPPPTTTTTTAPPTTSTTAGSNGSSTTSSAPGSSTPRTFATTSTTAPHTPSSTRPSTTSAPPSTKPSTTTTTTKGGGP